MHVLYTNYLRINRLVLRTWYTLDHKRNAESVVHNLFELNRYSQDVDRRKHLFLYSSSFAPFQTMKSDGSYYSVVLGWQTRANDEIECCLIHTTTTKAAKPITVTKSLIFLNNVRMNKRKRSCVPIKACIDATAITDDDQRSPILGPLVQIECRDATDDADQHQLQREDDLIIHGDTSQIELILPHVLFRGAPPIRDQWHYFFWSYQVDFDDDPWAAAKRGDLQALQSFAGIDWTKTDDFESTPLYYACHSGAATDILVVKYLLDVWPGPISPEVLSRCKKNAINSSVVQLLADSKNSSALAARREKPDCFSGSSFFLEGWNIFEEEEEFSDY